MAAQTGNTLFVSGHIARKDGRPWAGQLGKDLLGLEHLSADDLRLMGMAGMRNETIRPDAER